MKTQVIRLLDVFLIGPLMIAGAAKSRLRDPWRTALLVSGVMTVLYNGANYLQEREQ